MFVAAYFPEASVTRILPENIANVVRVVTGSDTPSPSPTVKQGDDFPGLNAWAEPLLTDAKRELGKPGEKLEFGQFNAVFSLDPKKPVVNEQADVTWTLTDNNGNPVSEWDTSVHRTLNHGYLIRTDFTSKSFHVHPSTGKNGIMTEVMRFPIAGEWALTTQIAKGGTMYLLTSVFTVVNNDGTTDSREPGEHTSDEQKVTGARGVDFTRTLPLKTWDVTMVVEGGEPVYAGEPFAVEWIVRSRGGENVSEISGGTLDGGHNILIAHIDDPSLIWNTHGDRSQESVSHIVGIPTRRWPTRDYPFKYTFTLPQPGVWWIHFEVQSSPIHFFIDVAGNPAAEAEARPLGFDTVAEKPSVDQNTLYENVVDFFTD